MNVQIYKRVREIISTRFQIPPETISAASSLVDDLKLDELDMIVIAIDMEKAFGVEIPQAAADAVVTVGDAVGLVENGHFLERP